MEGERRQGMDDLAEQVRFLRADIARVGTTVDRLDVRLTNLASDFQRALYTGNGHQPLVTEVAVHGEQIRTLEMRTRTSGAVWGGTLGAIASGAVMAIYYAVTGRAPGGN